MKFVKFSMLALAMGLFVASCGNKTEETTTTTDSAAMAPAPAPVDTMAAPAADTSMMHADTTMKK